MLLKKPTLQKPNGRFHGILRSDGEKVAPDGRGHFAYKLKFLINGQKLATGVKYTYVTEWILIKINVGVM